MKNITNKLFKFDLNERDESRFNPYFKIHALLGGATYNEYIFGSRLDGLRQNSFSIQDIITRL
jgi:hypothetical protein